MDSRGDLAARIVSALGERGQTLATAESLTGGMLGAAITAIPGASVVYRGGIVAYATELKTVLLGVPAGLLARHGPVHPDVAAAMAAGVRDRLGATWGLATTGVAGPDPGGRAAARHRAHRGQRGGARPPGPWPWPAAGTRSAGTPSGTP